MKKKRLKQSAYSLSLLCTLTGVTLPTWAIDDPHQCSLESQLKLNSPTNLENLENLEAHFSVAPDGRLIATTDTGRKKLNDWNKWLEPHGGVNGTLDGKKVLMLAIGKLHKFCIRYVIINCRADVNIADKKGFTPLMYAAQRGDLETVRMLVDASADIYAADEYGYTVLRIAIEKQNCELVEILITADENKRLINKVDGDGYTPLMCAAQQGNLKIVEMLIADGADIDMKDERGLTALAHAAWDGHPNIVQMLIEAKETVDAGEQRTALIYAVKYGRSACVEHLINAGVDVNAVGKDRRTLLQLAVEFGLSDVVEQLKQAGANVNVVDKDGRTLAEIAAKFEHLDLAEQLRQASAQNLDISTVGEDGYTTPH